MAKNNDLCNLCRKPILWAKTIAGNPVPLDREPRADGNIGLFGETAEVLEGDRPHHEMYAGPRYTNHRATCILDEKKRRPKQ